jgi:hypothetical protein
MVLLHTPQQAERTVDIDIVVIQWLFTTLSDSFQCSEVNHIVDVWVCRKDFIELCFVGDVAGEVLRPLPTYQLYPVEDFGGGVVEVVNNDNFVVGFKEGESGEGANVSCATAVVVST